MEKSHGIVGALVLAAASVLAACGTVTGAVAGAGPKPAASTANVSAPAGGTRATASTQAASVAACKSGTCWVDVTVATAWVKPWYPRAVDKPALGNPAYPGTWVSRLTLAQKKWLVGKLETQALYGTKVTVTGHWYGWSHVAISGQPTNRDSRGYPGWIPTVQLTRTAPSSAAAQAVVRSRKAWVFSGWTAAGVAGYKIMQVSYDTSFPVIRTAANYVLVRLIGGRAVAVRPADVIVHRSGTSWGATRAKVVAEARKFLGLAYLWAGTSAYAFDCSGFTHSVYRAYGVTIPRDADQQAVHGTRIVRSALRPGDLVFFRGSPGGPVTHVGMYIGGGMMIDAPHTGAAVRTERVWWSSYAGARRYLSR